VTRTIVALTAGVLSALLLAGCGSDEKTAKRTPSERATTTTTAATTSAPSAGRLTDLNSIE